MKKLAGLLCALALLCGFCLPVFADDTQSATISATVPAAHTLTVQGEGVQVFCNGQGGTSFAVERLSQPQLLLRAESGKTITQVLLNGQDITAAVQGGRYTPEPVYQELSLVVITRDAAATAGDTYTLTGRVTRNGTPVQGITLELRSTLKTTVTDADGRFTFTDVPCGKHSLTALENGNLAGYLEFILFEDANTYSSLNNGVYNVAVNKSEAGVDLALHLTDTNAMQLTAVSGIPAPAANSTQTPAPSAAAPSATPQPVLQRIIPQTGDNTPLALLILLCAASAVAFILLCAYKRKKKQ